MYVYAYVYVYKYTYIFIHTTYIYVYTYIHMYIYVYIKAKFLNSQKYTPFIGSMGKRADFRQFVEIVLRGGWLVQTPARGVEAPWY